MVSQTCLQFRGLPPSLLHRDFRNQRLVFTWYGERVIKVAFDSLKRTAAHVKDDKNKEANV